MCEKWRPEATLNLELREECSRTFGMGWKLLEQLMDAISVSSSQSGCNLGAAGEAGAAVEANTIEGNSRSRRNRGAVETDTIGE